MRRMMRGALFTVLLLVFAWVAPAQVDMRYGGFYTFGVISAAGQLGSYVTYGTNAPPASYTVDWSDAGTVPSACTFQLEGSSDATHWYSLTGSLDCTASNMIHVAYKPVRYARANVLTYTAGSGSTAVTINYTRGAQ